MSGPRPAMERTFACSSSASNARPRDKLPRGRAKSPRRRATAPGRSLNRIVEASGSAGDTPSARKGGNRNVDDVKVKARSGHVGQPWVGVADRKGVALGLAHPALVRAPGLPGGDGGPAGRTGACPPGAGAGAVPQGEGAHRAHRSNGVRAAVSPCRRELRAALEADSQCGGRGRPRSEGDRHRSGRRWRDGVVGRGPASRGDDSQMPRTATRRTLGETVPAQTQGDAGGEARPVEVQDTASGLDIAESAPPGAERPAVGAVGCAVRRRRGG